MVISQHIHYFNSINMILIRKLSSINGIEFIFHLNLNFIKLMKYQVSNILLIFLGSKNCFVNVNLGLSMIFQFIVEECNLQMTMLLLKNLVNLKLDVSIKDLMINFKAYMLRYIFPIHFYKLFLPLNIPLHLSINLYQVFVMV